MNNDIYKQSDDRSESVADELPDWAKGRVDSVVGIQREESVSEATSRNRLRSIECTNIEVLIVSFEMVSATEKAGAHVSYVIQVAPGVSKKWCVKRRYNDFVYLDAQLRKPTGQLKIKIPVLPKKRYFGSSTEPKFVEERRVQLEEYLRAIMAIPHVWIRSDLPRFLDNESNSMIFLWNFERVKKMQEIVNTMAVESNSDKQKLTGELTAARQQVSILQSRINRMEMIFLQQAAGVATESLPSSVVRSISSVNASGVNISASSLLHDDNMELDDVTPSTSENSLNALRAALEGGQDMHVPEQPVVEDNEDRLIMEEAVYRLASDGKQMNSREIMDVLAMARQESHDHIARPSRAQSDEELRTWAISAKLKEALELGNEILDEKYYLDDLSKKASFSHRSDIDSLSSISTKHDSVASRKMSDQSIDESVKLLLAYRPSSSSDQHESDASMSGIATLCKSFDQLVHMLTPTAEVHEDRMRIFEYLRAMMFVHLGVHIFPVGSFLSRTYLPLGDMDVTAFFLHQDDDNWFVRVNEILCMTAFGGNGYYPVSLLPTQPVGSDLMSESDMGMRSRYTINNVSFVNADTKIIKSSINGVSIDLSANQIGALYLQIFLEMIDQHVGQDHLFKRSLILIKAWCTYESHKYSRGSGSVTGTKDGRLSTSSLNIMTMWIFHAYGKRISCPIQALYRFLAFYSTFNWNMYALTIRGPVSAIDLSTVEYPMNDDDVIDRFFPEELMDSYKDRYAEARDTYLFNAIAPFLPKPDKHIIPSSDPTDESAAIPAPIPAPISTPILSAELLEMKNRSADSWISHAAFDDAVTFHKRGLMNIMNPVAPKNNISRAVDSFGYRAIQHAFHDGYHALRQCIDRMDSLGEMTSSTEPLAQYLLISTSTDDMAKDEIHRYNEGASSSSHHHHTSSMNDDSNRVIVEFMMNTCVNVIVPILRGTQSTSSGRRITPLTSLSNSPSPISKPYDISHHDSNPSSTADNLSISFPDIEFTLNFCEMILGCKIRQDTIISLVIEILNQRGSLPVGEIGKVLQLLTGGDSISRRLKDQLGGLKRTIEAATESGIKVGSEHPFNPMLSLEKHDATSTLPSTSANNHNIKSITRYNHVGKIVHFMLSSSNKDANNMMLGGNSSVGKGWGSGSVAGSISSSINPRKQQSSSYNSRTGSYSPQGSKSTRNYPSDSSYGRRTGNKTSNFPNMYQPGSSPYSISSHMGAPSYMSNDSHDDYQSQMSMSPNRGGSVRSMPGSFSDPPYDHASPAMMASSGMPPQVYSLPATGYYVPIITQPTMIPAPTMYAYGQPAMSQLSPQQQQLLLQQQYQQQLLAQQQQQMQYMYYSQQSNPPPGPGLAPYPEQQQQSSPPHQSHSQTD